MVTAVHTAASETVDPNVSWDPHPAFGYIEIVCIAWFTAEYLARLAVAPRRIAFILDVMNIVDLVAIVPFYIEKLLALFGLSPASFAKFKGLLLFFC